jgi:hypothetical protein
LPLLLLFWIHAPDNATDVAGAAVDLVDHAPRIRDVEEAVLGEWGRLVALVAAAATERNGVGEPKVLNVALVDAGERGEALAIISAVVHQPQAAICETCSPCGAPNLSATEGGGQTTSPVAGAQEKGPTKEGRGRKDCARYSMLANGGEGRMNP